MAIADRYKEKQLTCVKISFTGTAGSTVVVKCSVNGGSFNTIISDTTNGEATVEATAFNDGTNFDLGREFQFQIESTGGASIKELCYYYDPIVTQQ
jgi:predicted methyltransferase